MFWCERDLPLPQPDGTIPGVNEGEAYGIIGSSTGSRYIEVLTNSQLGPHQFTSFIQQNQPPETGDGTQALLGLGRKRKQSLEAVGGELTGITAEDLDPTTGQIKKKSKSNISRDYHDAEFRRLLLTLLNNCLPPQSQKTRLPRGFFGPYLEKHGLELVGLPEKPVEIGEGGKIGGWSADALRRNLEAVRANRVFIRKIDQLEPDGVELADITVENEPEHIEVSEEPHVDQEQEAARILAEGAGTRRGRRSAAAK